MSLLALSDEQAAAALSAQDHLLVIAPPGCGKTEVLAHRAAHQASLLDRNQRVLALTFTKRARSNLEDRLRSVLGHQRARRQVVVRNFHGFATQVVLAHGRTIGLNLETLALPKTNTMRKAMDAASGHGPTKFAAEGLLSQIKRLALSDDEVLAALQRSAPGPVRTLAIDVERARREANALHYDDLIRHAQRLLRIPAVARLYQAHFGAVLVDEFQDLSEQQLDLALLSCTARRTFAGDPLQGIFSWAGAAPAAVEEAVRSSTGDPLRLQESYRSSPKVLELVNSISEQIDPDARLRSAAPEHWLEGGCAATLTFNTRDEEAAALVDLAQTITTQHPNASIGIIARAGWRREGVDTAFAGSLPFPVRRWDFAIDDPEIVALIKSVVGSLPRGTSVDDAKTAVINAIDPSDVEVRELAEAAFDTLGGIGATTARGAIKTLRVADPAQPIGPGVHLLNAHTGKGQQFDWVIVIGLEEGHLPIKRNNQGEALAEEHRTLLVMLSRARHGLVVTRSLMNDGPYGRYRATPSRWWQQLGADLSSVEAIQGHLRGAVATAVP